MALSRSEPWTESTNQPGKHGMSTGKTAQKGYGGNQPLSDSIWGKSGQKPMTQGG